MKGGYMKKVNDKMSPSDWFLEMTHAMDSQTIDNDTKVLIYAMWKRLDKIHRISCDIEKSKYNATFKPLSDLLRKALE
jgi:hypothetical protein